MIAEYTESAANPTSPLWSKSYVYLGARLLVTIAPSGASERVEYQHPDRLGTRLVTNNQDTSFIEQVTLPFGTALDAESTGTTKRRFTSYDRSTVSGLDYAVNRHYDPLQGRFTQVDPIGMASVDLRNPKRLNLFAYCTNDPINQTDQSGLGFFSFLGKIFGFFAKIVKWLVFAIAVTVAVLTIAWLGFGAVWALKGLLILGQLWGTVIFSAAETGATVTAGEVIGVIAGVGAVNSFMAKKHHRRAPKRKGDNVEGRPCPADKLRFFNWLVGPLTKMAQDLNTTKELMLTQAAKEAGWTTSDLDHNQPLNNPFGVNIIRHGRAAGNRHYSSLDQAIEDWKRMYADRVRGTRTPEAFGHGMQHPAQGQPYNSWNKNYEAEYTARYADVLKWMKICGIQ